MDDQGTTVKGAMGEMPGRYQQNSKHPNDALLTMAISSQSSLSLSDPHMLYMPVYSNLI